MPRDYDVLIGGNRRGVTTKAICKNDLLQQEHDIYCSYHAKRMNSCSKYSYSWSVPRFSLVLTLLRSLQGDASAGNPSAL
jgi:hypothetical protein